MAEEEELQPKDAKLVKSVLRAMGVQRYESRVVNQFLDIWYRYVVDILGDAQVYSEHAGKTVIDCADVKLAIQSRVNFSFTQPPPRETLMELARLRNSIPLPKVIAGPGLALPPEQDTLIAPNYQLDIPHEYKITDWEMEDDDDEDEDDENQADGAKGAGLQPTALQKSDQDGRKVSFSLAGKRPKS